MYYFQINIGVLLVFPVQGRNNMHNLGFMSIISSAILSGVESIGLILGLKLGLKL